MDIFICDPGLRAQGSHHFNWTILVAEEFRRVGHVVRTYGYAEMDIEVQKQTEALPHFIDFTYQKHDKQWPCDEQQNWLLGNDSFKSDLERLSSEIAYPEAIVIIPTITQHQLDGLARWYENLTPERRPRLAVSLMFHPQWTPWGDHAVRGPEYYAGAIDKLRPWLGKSVLLYTETPEAKAVYEQLTSAHVIVAPIPLMRKKCVLPRRPEGHICFGYFGHARAEKGFHLLPAAVNICRRRGLDLNLIVQINHDKFDPRTVRAARELRSIPNVSTIFGPMDIEQYYLTLEYCNIILLPYDPTNYYLRGSGLFVEAIAQGKPLIVSAGTVMENVAKRGDCVAQLCEFSAAGLALAMCEASSHYRDMEEAAKLVADRWYNANNASVFCRQILEFADAPAEVVIADGSDCRNAEPLNNGPYLGAQASAEFEPPRRINSSSRIRFIPDGLDVSKGLVVDVGLDKDCGAPNSVSLELNGHRLGSIAVDGERRSHVIPGPFRFLKDGLPTTLKLEPLGGMALLYAFRFLPASWHQSFFARLGHNRLAG